MARVFFCFVLFCIVVFCFFFINQSHNALVLPDQCKRELRCGHSKLNVLATFSVLLRLFQYDEKEAYENFKQFYEDTLPEFRKAGTVVQFKVTFASFSPHCFEKKKQ